MDCDDDGIEDHTCFDENNYGIVSTGGNCRNTYPNGKCGIFF